MNDKLERAKFAQKLLAVMKTVGSIPKNGHNKHHDYWFHRHDDIVEALRGALVDCGLAITQSVVTCEWVPTGSKNRSGAEVKSIRVVVEYTLIDADTGYAETFKSAGESMEAEDKGPQKALVFAEKYWLKGMFKISEGPLDDPDGDPPAQTTHSKVEEPKKEEKPEAPKVEAPKSDPVMETRKPAAAATIEPSAGERRVNIAASGDRATWLGVSFAYEVLGLGEISPGKKSVVRDALLARGFNVEEVDKAIELFATQLNLGKEQRTVWRNFFLWLENTLDPSIARLRWLLWQQPSEEAPEKGRKEQYAELASLLSWPDVDRDEDHWMKVASLVTMVDLDERPVPAGSHILLELTGEEFDDLLTAMKRALDTGLDPAPVTAWREAKMGGAE